MEDQTIDRVNNGSELSEQSINQLDQWILEFQQGDQDAFRNIYEATFPWVRATVYRRLEVSQVEDCIQEIYGKLVEKSNLYSADKGSFYTWFHTVVINQTTDVWRKQHKIREMEVAAVVKDEEGDYSEMEFESKAFVPETEADKKSAAMMLRELLAELTSEQKQCIILHFLEHMKNSEIAEMLGISENTVKSRIHKGMKRMEYRGNEMRKAGVTFFSMSPLLFFRSYAPNHAQEVYEQVISKVDTWEKMKLQLTSANSSTVANEAASSVAKSTQRMTSELPSGNNVHAGIDSVKIANTSLKNAAVASSGAVAGKAAIGLSMKSIAAIIAGTIAVAGLGIGGMKIVRNNSANSGSPVVLETEEESTEAIETVSIPIVAETEEPVAEETAAETEAEVQKFESAMDGYKSTLQELVDENDPEDVYQYAHLLDINEDGTEEMIVLTGGVHLRIYQFTDGVVSEVYESRAAGFEDEYGVASFISVCTGELNIPGYGDMPVYENVADKSMEDIKKEYDKYRFTSLEINDSEHYVQLVTLEAEEGNTFLRITADNGQIVSDVYNTTHQNDGSSVVERNGVVLEGVQNFSQGGSEIPSDDTNKILGIGEAVSDNWAKAYYDYLNTDDWGKFSTYVLAYIDEDDVPEILALSDIHSINSILLTQRDNVVSKVEIDITGIDYLEFYYLEKQGRIMVKNGSTYFTISAYDLVDGTAKIIDSIEGEYNREMELEMSNGMSYKECMESLIDTKSDDFHDIYDDDVLLTRSDMLKKLKALMY